MTFQHHETSYHVKAFVPHKINVTLSYQAPSFQEIIKVTAKVFDVSVERIVGPVRDRPTCRARWAAMYIAWERKGPSYPELGRPFHRDHTTCMHGVKLANEIMGGMHDTKYNGEDFREKVSQIVTALVI